MTEGIDRLARQAELLRTDLVAERKARVLLEGDIGAIGDRLAGVTESLARVEEAAAALTDRDRLLSLPQHETIAVPDSAEPSAPEPSPPEPSPPVEAEAAPVESPEEAAAPEPGAEDEH